MSAIRDSEAIRPPKSSGDEGNVWQRLRRNDNARKFVACIIGALVAAVITGPSGSVSHPTAGFTGALFHPRVVVFLVLGVLLWLAMVGRETLSENIKAVTDPISAARTKWLGDPKVRYSLYAALLVFAIIYPRSLSSFWQGVLVDQIGVYVLLAIGLNVVVGFAGLLDLGYIAFYAIGAYSCAYWTGALPIKPVFHLNPFVSIVLAVAAAMIAGVILGAPTLRLRGDYLAIVTLGFGEIITIYANNLQSVTGGAGGTNVIPHLSVNLLGVKYHWKLDSLPYYYLLLVFVVAILVMFRALENSRVGRAWTAIREDEVAAEASGVNTFKYKLLAFAMGASTSGFAGVLFASKVQTLYPSSFALTESILILVLVIFGGMGSLPGAVLGAAVLQWLPQFLRGKINQADLFLYLGALLVIMMIFRPQGIWPSRRRARELAMAEAGLIEADAVSGPPAGEVQ
jgi:branched-chain amino acid transport system permease protein